MEKNTLAPYLFTIRDFIYNNIAFRVSLTPELCPYDGELDFTGRYLGIFISEKKGTQAFELEPDHHTRWQSVPKGMDPGLIDELDKIIQHIRKQ